MAAKTDEEREFYLLCTKKNSYSARIDCRISNSPASEGFAHKQAT